MKIIKSSIKAIGGGGQVLVATALLVAGLNAFTQSNFNASIVDMAGYMHATKVTDGNLINMSQKKSLSSDIAFIKGIFDTDVTIQRGKSSYASMSDDESITITLNPFSGLLYRQGAYYPELKKIEGLAETRSLIEDKLGTDFFSEDVVYTAIASHHGVDKEFLRNAKTSVILMHEAVHAVGYESTTDLIAALELEENKQPTFSALHEYLGDRKGLELFLFKLASEHAPQGNAEFVAQSKAVVDMFALFRMNTSFDNDTHVGAVLAIDEMIDIVNADGYSVDHALTQFHPDKMKASVADQLYSWDHYVHADEDYGHHEPNRVVTGNAKVFFDKVKAVSDTYVADQNERFTWLEGAVITAANDYEACSVKTKDNSLKSMIGDFRNCNLLNDVENENTNTPTPQV